MTTDDETEAKGLGARGRSKSLAIRHRIFDAARQHFFERGFQLSSVDAIAETAGVSNRTIYSHFQNKEDLLWSLLQHEGFKRLPRFPEWLPRTREELVQWLTDFGAELLKFLSHSDTVSMGKIMLEEALRHPQTAANFYDLGPKRTEDRIVDVLRLAKKNKWLTMRNPRTAAKQLLGMWQYAWLLPQQLGLSKPLTSKQINVQVKSGLETFFLAFDSERAPSFSFPSPRRDDSDSAGVNSTASPPV